VAAAAKPEILARIHATTDAARLAEADFAVEAVPERLDLKRAVLGEADRALRPEAILASNTSSISIAALAAATSRPDRFVGMHFMNPVPVMELVEVVRAPQTSEATLATTMEIARSLGKTPVAVNDAPGFVANRVLMPMINEAAFAVMEGVAAPEAVDAVMRTGMNHPMGPLELADLIGIDVCVDILDVLEAGFSRSKESSKFSACPLLRKMVAEGRLGRKSGRGFYKY
jgi:3-hydroxybutyryl-CoA dehydrogenase